jgi:hypothetical protein
MGEFLKGYMRKKMSRAAVLTGYSQDGDFRGLAQAWDNEICFRSVAVRC